MPVLSTCIAAGYPVACVIGGGYSIDTHVTTERHRLLYRVASFRPYRW
ncbi:hypothetical protein [Baaleninema sp.]